VDVLLAPHVGELEMRVASITMLHGVPLLRVAGMVPRRASVRVPPRDRTRHGVAILGTRGVPANYGGFETFAERLALQLVDQQVATSVYCRAHYATEDSPWRGIRLISLPTIRSKYLDTVVHTALSALHLVLTRGPRDVVLCNAANAPVLVLLRLFRRRVVLNVDGLEWRRTKWGVAGRAWYRMGEWLSVRLACVLVTDAYEVQTYYRVRHDTDSVMIPYGADLLERGSLPIPPVTPVVPDSYVLYVSRWERENNPLMVARAHAASGVRLGLVMLGDATYDEGLGAEVRAAARSDACLPGPVFGDAYRGLQTNAACYVHATEVGGTHPALIEAMGAGNLVLALDTPENREVVGNAGVFFADEAQLVDRLAWASGLSSSERNAWRDRARAHAAVTYSWSAVSSAYLELLGAPPVR
jgi:glycosyltransferase involved in cell wall biosynthesis